MHAWRELRDSYILKAVIEELPEDVGFELSWDNATTSKSTGSRKKRKSTADILESHLQGRQDRKSGDDILKTQKAVQVQLKCYCMGTKELISLKK
jgi:hypothetical protein